MKQKKPPLNGAKILLYVICDVLFIDLALLTAMALWYTGIIPGSGGVIRSVPDAGWVWFAYLGLIGPVISVIVLACLRLYNNLWRYADIDEILKIFLATAIIMVLLYIVDLLFTKSIHVMPRRVFLVAWFIHFILCLASRLGDRALRRVLVTVGHMMSSKAGCRRVLVVGAGYAGYGLVRDMLRSSVRERVPALIVDDDPAKNNAVIMGIRIVNGISRIPYLVTTYEIDEIIIAIPSATNAEMREILEYCTQTDCRLKIVPPISDVTDSFWRPGLRDVSISDLLYRDEIRLDNQNISGYIEGAPVMVTGGGGSIGSELCRQIAQYNPSRIIIVDIYENNAYELLNELREQYGERLDIVFRVGSIRDMARMNALFDEFRPTVVFHAAAHKHVILMEESPAEAVKNNIFGTLNVIKCAIRYKAERFVLLSSDKAVNPTNIYGATKRVTELIMQRMAADEPHTKLMAVRFGNVMGSQGSAIPKFKRQIAGGGPVTVYHPDAERFFMTIPEACQLVLQAASMAQSGHIFVLDMGDRVNIEDLARKLIKLSGYKPDEDIKIIYTGLLPGEKLYEELVLPEEQDSLQVSCHEKIWITQPVPMDYAQFDGQIKKLYTLAYKHPEQIGSALQAMNLHYEPKG